MFPLDSRGGDWYYTTGGDADECRLEHYTLLFVLPYLIPTRPAANLVSRITLDNPAEDLHAHPNCRNDCPAARTFQNTEVVGMPEGDLFGCDVHMHSEIRYIRLSFRSARGMS